MKKWSHDIGTPPLQNIDDVDMKTHWSHQSYEQGNPTQNPLNSGLGVIICPDVWKCLILKLMGF